MSFSALGLSDVLVRAAADLGYAAPTPVQRQAIPAILRGDDVWASAKTGSGKTAAFLLPLLDVLAARPARAPRPLRTLVLVPTRELALQVGAAVERLGRHMPAPLVTRVAIGGVSINPQLMALRSGADVVVATPGRLLDLVEHNALSLGTVQTLVLDEADRLFALGFADELARVLALLPERRQNLLFSATLPAPVLALAAAMLREPTRIDLDAGQTPDAQTITQRAIRVDEGKRTLLLRHLLESEKWSHVLVFVESAHRADHLTTKLTRVGIAAAPLSGELSQGARTKALADFKAQKLRVLVATDVAARGLDIAQLPAVVNYDLPRSATDYLHRIGRTGRAGERGVAVSFVTADSEAHFHLIEKRHRLRLPLERLAGFEPTDVARPTLDPHGGVKGKRKSKKDKLREAVARGGEKPGS